MNTKDPCRVGNEVIVLTTSYHWTGRIVEATPFALVLEDAAMFVDIGQIGDAQHGNFKGANCDPLDGYHKVPAPPASQVIDYLGEKLPRKRLKSS